MLNILIFMGEKLNKNFIIKYYYFIMKEWKIGTYKICDEHNLQNENA